MFSYYLKLSLHNLKRAPMLYFLVVLTIAIGVGALTANLALIKTMAGDPIPDKSERLFHISMNTWPAINPRSQPLDITRYVDLKAIKDSGIADKFTMTYRSSGFAKRADSTEPKRYPVTVRPGNLDFLEMMNAPFAQGRNFSQAHSKEVVIGHKLNQRLFNGENSVGKVLDIKDKLYTIVGVLEPWKLKPKFYQPGFGIDFNGEEDVYMPIETAIDDGFYIDLVSMSTDSWGQMPEIRNKSVYFLHGWVQLNTPEQKQRLLDFMQQYCQKLKDDGNHPFDINNQLLNVKEYLIYKKVVDKRVMAFAIATALFLLVCLFNASSLLLSRYHAANFETGLQRALGASKKQIFYQGIVESLITGLMAAALSIGLGWAFLTISAKFLPNLGELAEFDTTIVLYGFALAILTTLISTFYPVLRTANTAISLELKG